MNKYTVVVKNTILRMACRGWLEFLGEKRVAGLVYYLKTGNVLDFNNPVTFNQKLQWLKVFDHNPLYSMLVDKIEAKKVVSELISKEIVVPLYGVWDDASEIDYDLLPSKFVLKCNHDQGSVVIVHDKNKIDRKEIEKFLNYKLSRNNYYTTREYGYKRIKPRVFAEEYLGGSIRDYKFYCFNGEPKFLYVGQGLTIDHSLRIDYFDIEWKMMPFYRNDYLRLGNVEKPKHFEEMLGIAKALSKDIPFVRVDLFEENGKVYFSEFSPCPASGYMPFVPEEYDTIVGSWLKLMRYDEKKNKYIEI